MKYPKEYLDEIKLRLKVSQVVGKHVKLKNLKVLVLSDNRLDDSSIADFLFSPHFQNLESQGTLHNIGFLLHPVYIQHVL